MKEALQVKTFGGFTLTWQGKNISGDSKGRDSQFTRLMEILLHERGKGVNRAHLEDVLFEDSDLADVRHMLRSVIYNSKQKLKKAGLPEVNYIRNEDGMYYWNEEIPVVEDACEFEEKFEAAEKEEDPAVKMRLYVEATHLYTGDFLPDQTRFVWVAQEDRRYRAIFCQCVENAAAIMRENKDFLSLESIGRYAAQRQPLSDWETLIMEALVAMERYDEASQLYEKTVDYYMEELGTRPSFALMSLLDKMTERMNYQYAMLDEIQGRLSGRTDEEEDIGGYICSYPVFQGVYRMVERMMERGGQSIYLMLCTIVDKKGVPLSDPKILEELIGKLGDAICHSVRHSDAICKYGRNQYLVLLVNTTRENCTIVQDRINEYFTADRKKSSIQYYVNSVITSTDELL